MIGFQEKKFAWKIVLMCGQASTFPPGMSEGPFLAPSSPPDTPDPTYKMPFFTSSLHRRVVSYNLNCSMDDNLNNIIWPHSLGVQSYPHLWWCPLSSTGAVAWLWTRPQVGPPSPSTSRVGAVSAWTQNLPEIWPPQSESCKKMFHDHKNIQGRSFHFKMKAKLHFYFLPGFP